MDSSYFSESLLSLCQWTLSSNGLRTTKSVLAGSPTLGATLHCLQFQVGSPPTAAESQLSCLPMVQGATPLSSLRTRRSKIWKGRGIWRWYNPSSEFWIPWCPQRGIAPDELGVFHLLASLLFSPPSDSQYIAVDVYFVICCLLSFILMH